MPEARGPSRPPHSFRISCLAKAEGAAAEHQAEITITILNPAMAAPEFKGVASVQKRLRFFFNDQESTEADGMKEAVSELVALGTSWRGKPLPRLLVHCHGGISRSTAAAYILMCAAEPQRSFAGHFDQLLAIARKPWPNLRMIEMAGDLLKARGAMTAPLLAYRAQYPARIDAYDRFNAQRGLASAYKR